MSRNQFKSKWLFHLLQNDNFFDFFFVVKAIYYSYELLLEHDVLACIYTINTINCIIKL